MRPGMLGLSFAVENKLVHGIFYHVGGEVPAPTVVICHGFPGFEKNGDMAQDLRRAGFNVLLFSYRGAWGSQGDFAFSHVVADTCKAVCYVVSDEFPLKAIVRRDGVAVVGHSMGGFAALMAASRSTKIKHVVSIAGWNIGRSTRDSRSSPIVKARVDSILSGATVLQGTTAATLWNEMYRNESDYDLCSLPPTLAGRDVLLIAAERDADTPPEDNHVPLLKSFINANVNVEEKWFDADHSFAEKRVELAEIIATWLDDKLKAKM